MSKGKLIAIILLVLTVVGLGIVKYRTGKTKEDKMNAKGSSPKQLTASGYIVGYSGLSNDLEANGTLVAQDEVQLQPEASGRVTQIHIKEGALVEKGTLLLKLNDADLQAQLKKLKPQYKIAQRNLERLSELLKVKGVSQSEYDAAENNLNNIEADIDLLNVQIAKTELRAPFSGRLGLRNISLGAYVNSTTVVVSLQNLNQMKVDLTVPEKYMSAIKIGDPMECSVAGIEGTFVAKVVAIEPTIDALTRNLKIRALIQEPHSKFIPGAYVKVNLKLGQLPRAILIPSSTVIPDDKATKVVVVDSGKVKFVPITIGSRTASEVEVLKGLEVGDTVLTTGLLQAKPNLPVKITKIINP